METTSIDQSASTVGLVDTRQARQHLGYSWPVVVAGQTSGIPLAGTVETLKEILCTKVAVLVEQQVGAVKRQCNVYFLIPWSGSRLTRLQSRQAVEYQVLSANNQFVPSYLAGMTHGCSTVTGLSFSTKIQPT